LQVVLLMLPLLGLAVLLLVKKLYPDLYLWAVPHKLVQTVSDVGDLDKPAAESAGH